MTGWHCRRPWTGWFPNNLAWSVTLTTDTDQDHPCLPGGLIPLDQWKSPETSVHKTVRAGFQDILEQLRSSITPEGQIGRAHVNSSHVKNSYAVFCLKK